MLKFLTYCVLYLNVKVTSLFKGTFFLFIFCVVSVVLCIGTRYERGLRPSLNERPVFHLMSGVAIDVAAAYARIRIPRCGTNCRRQREL